MSKPTGYLCIVLHAHLPFIRHPEHATFLEENWLFEAMTDCYIPLLDVFNGLVRDGVPWRLAMSVTPPLAEMLLDPLLMDRYERRVRSLIDLAGQEMERTRHDPTLHRLARMYYDRFQHTWNAFTKVYGRNLLAAFGRLQQSGHLELIASAATHAYLPLLHPDAAGAEVQVDIGIESYKRAFRRAPSGFWLPECGYAPPLDDVLAAKGIRWFIAESHGLLHAWPPPRDGVHAPILCSGTDDRLRDGGGWVGSNGANGLHRTTTGLAAGSLAAFARDTESSKQVWSATEGYPGDFDYRDFYRDIGFDLDYDYVRPWLQSEHRGHTGIKYYRITGTGDHKELYDPAAAEAKAAMHAGNFMFNRELQVRHLRSTMQQPPVIVAPYDAELFGHWWFEGPRWLDILIRKIAYDQHTIQLVTPSDYLARHPDIAAADPSPSSWGYGGYNDVWLNGANDWIYRHLHTAERRLYALAAQVHDPPPLVRRALNQALRELLLAQSSDWAFIMSTDTHVPYAVRRTREHVVHCLQLCRDIEAGAVDEARLGELESRHNIFPWIDYTVMRQSRLGETMSTADADLASAKAAAVP